MEFVAAVSFHADYFGKSSFSAVSRTLLMNGRLDIQ